MEQERIFMILQYVCILVTSFTAVNAAVARRLTNINDNGKGGITEENSLYIKLKSADDTVDNSLNHYVHTVPVHHFARHGLCSHDEGQKTFYRAIKSKFCQINEKFIASLVEDLCKHRGSFLDKWVKELFDIDGDGMITHFEKTFYESDE